MSGQPRTIEVFECVLIESERYGSCDNALERSTAGDVEGLTWTSSLSPPELVQ